MSADSFGFDLKHCALTAYAADPLLVMPAPLALLLMLKETTHHEDSELNPYALFLASLHDAAGVATAPLPPREPDLNTMTSAQQEPLGGSLLHCELARALERCELSLVYQPRVDPRTGLVLATEALSRWHSARFGGVAPDVFVPVAEQTGFIVPFGNWVLREAAKELRRWIDTGITGVCMSVNVSMHQLLHPLLEEQVRTVIDACGIPPQALELELTESAVMHDRERTIAILHRLRRMGVRIAVDDFGTGYSCLAYLKRLPVDTLKIDKEFTTDIGTSHSANTLVSAMIAMAHSLGIRVVVEGVETRAQWDFLAAHDCDEVQGFYCSPPLVGEECQPYLMLHQ